MTTTTHEAKVALWNRLRADPDYDPSWAGFMGHNPPKPPVERYRTWGDGATDQREHVIVDISWRPPRFITCRCGHSVEAMSNDTLEDLWSLHLGLSPEEVAADRLANFAVDLATSEEVSAFIGRAANPEYKYTADE